MMSEIKICINQKLLDHKNKKIVHQKQLDPENEKPANQKHYDPKNTKICKLRIVINQGTNFGKNVPRGKTTVLKRGGGSFLPSVLLPKMIFSIHNSAFFSEKYIKNTSKYIKIHKKSPSAAQEDFLFSEYLRILRLFVDYSSKNSGQKNHPVQPRRIFNVPNICEFFVFLSISAAKTGGRINPPPLSKSTLF